MFLKSLGARGLHALKQFVRCHLAYTAATGAKPLRGCRIGFISKLMEQPNGMLVFLQMRGHQQPRVVIQADCTTIKGLLRVGPNSINNARSESSMLLNCTSLGSARCTRARLSKSNSGL